MRVNADPDSAHHWSKNFYRCPNVALDGVRMKFVKEADDQAGTVTVYDVDADERFTLEADCIRTRQLRGSVVFFGPRRVNG